MTELNQVYLISPKLTELRSKQISVQKESRYKFQDKCCPALIQMKLT